MQKFVTHNLYGMNEYGAAVTEVLPKGEPKHVYLASAADVLIGDLKSAVRELLQDTQHVNHNCGDGPDLCPVARAREVLNELMER